MKNKILILGLVLATTFNTIAQDNGYTGGFQFKAMLGNGIFDNAPVTSETDVVSIKIQQNFGYSFGMTFRKQFTKILAVESGLRFTQRNYTTSVDSLATNFNSAIPFRFIAYEIPLKAMVRLRASDNSFFSVSLGGQLDLYPSDVFASDNEWQVQITRRSWIQGSFIANMGWEYHPIGVGTFYGGFAFNQPFVDPYSANVGIANSLVAVSNVRLNGAYFSLDFRYYFEVKKDK